MFSLKKNNRKIEQMENQFQGLQGHIAAGNNSNLFISKSLPILLHLQICEAIQEITGKEFQTELIEFERKKIKELDDYAKTSDFSCISSMHQRLMMYSSRMAIMDKGVSKSVEKTVKKKVAKFTLTLAKKLYAKDCVVVKDYKKKPILRINGQYGMYLKYEEKKRKIDSKLSESIGKLKGDELYKKYFS